MTDAKKIMIKAYNRVRRSHVPKIQVGHLSVENTRHRETKVTWMTAGNGKYWWIIYCPECKAGTITDLVDEVPDVPDAKTLGVIKKKVWSLDCPVVIKENRERGEQAKLDLPKT